MTSAVLQLNVKTSDAVVDGQWTEQGVFLQPCHQLPSGDCGEIIRGGYRIWQGSDIFWLHNLPLSIAVS